MVATIALALVVWQRHRSGGSGTSPTVAQTGSGAESQAPLPAPVPSSGARQRPVLEVRDGGAAGAPALPFADETPDPAWADPQEADVGRIARTALVNGKLGDAADVSKVDCRQTRCRFDVIARDPARLPDVLAVLEDDRGFYGVAKEMAVTSMERNDAGVPVRMTIVLTFDRNPPGGDPAH